MIIRHTDYGYIKTTLTLSYVSLNTLLIVVTVLRKGCRFQSAVGEVVRPSSSSCQECPAIANKALPQIRNITWWSKRTFTVWAFVAQNVVSRKIFNYFANRAAIVAWRHGSTCWGSKVTCILMSTTIDATGLALNVNFEVSQGRIVVFCCPLPLYISITVQWVPFNVILLVQVDFMTLCGIFYNPERQVYMYYWVPTRRWFTQPQCSSLHNSVELCMLLLGARGNRKMRTFLARFSSEHFSCVLQRTALHLMLTVFPRLNAALE